MTNNSHILVIGLTGNIGSGKTAAVIFFEQLGAKVFYADTMAKELMISDSKVRKQIRESFGKEAYLPDGTLNRKYLAKEVFSDELKREMLNAIVHPAVISELKKLIKNEQIRSKNRVIVVEAALLYEAGISEMFSYVIVVSADEPLCIKRIQERDGLSNKEILNRIHSQMDSKAKEAKADFIIKNNGSVQDLEQKVKFIFNLLTQLNQ